MSLLEEYYDRFENPPTDTVKKILFAFIGDLSGRKGFDHWWDHLDETVQLEILEENFKTIRENLPNSTHAFKYTGTYSNLWSKEGLTFTFTATNDEMAIILFHKEVRGKGGKAAPVSLCRDDHRIWSKELP